MCIFFDLIWGIAAGIVSVTMNGEQEPVGKAFDSSYCNNRMQPFIQLLPGFSGLPPELFKEAVKHTGIYFHRAGTLLRSAGDTSDRIYFIRKGLVHIYRGEGKKKKTEWLASEGEYICPFNRFMLQQPSGVYYETLEKTEVHVITFPVFMQLYRHPLFRKAADALAMERLYHINDFLLKNCGSAGNRYANFLEFFPNLDNRVPLQFIASLLDVCPKTISRIRAQSYKMSKSLTA